MNIVKSGFSCCHWLISVAFTNIKLRFLKHRAFKKGAAPGALYNFYNLHRLKEAQLPTYFRYAVLICAVATRT